MSRISTYQELRAERLRLESDARRQQLYIKSSLQELKDKFAPVARAISFVTGIGKNKSTAGTLLKLGSSVGIDMLIGPKLKKAGWLARVLVPLALKLTARNTLGKVSK